MTELLFDLAWLNRLQSYKQLVVGFSGGLDSTVLLHWCASIPALKSRLLAVHVNHGLSSNALSWQIHCERWCAQLQIPFVTHAVEFNRDANIEEGARTARYALFQDLVPKDGCLLLGHHKDDQAETLLLNLFRGAGVDGLAAMPEIASFGLGVVARPLLSCFQVQLSHYAQCHQLQWIEDESNEDSYYSRNYLRHRVMPLLNEKWPGVVSNLARTAKHCQSAQMNLYALAQEDCAALKKETTSLDTAPLENLSEERLVNVLRYWLKSNAVKSPSTAVCSQIIRLIDAAEDANPVVRWHDISIRRYQKILYIERETLDVRQEAFWTDFPKPLKLGNKIVHARPAHQGLFIPQGAQLRITFRQGGESFVFRGQTKSLKKLFQQWHIPPWLRAGVPLLYIDNQLAAVAGYAISDSFFVTREPAWELWFD